jgi:hypothetical protein
VLSNDASHIFSINIACGKTVGALDENQHEFGPVDSKILILWKVSMPIHQCLNKMLDELDVINEGLLLPVEELSQPS